MKHEWKKQEKALYGAKQTPALVMVPQQQFITLSGQGNPNESTFSEKVGALYALAYAIKMNYKATMADAPENQIQDFTVYPLEGIWSQEQEGELNKDTLNYMIMLRQPDFITEAMVNDALAKVKKKKPNPFYDDITFSTMHDGQCIEILHIGPFDDEPTSFAKMAQFAQSHGLNRTKKLPSRNLFKQ